MRGARLPAWSAVMLAVIAVGVSAGSRYHRFLPPREFAERFAPTAEQTRAVTKALQRAGFQIVQTYPGGTLIRARAATANLARYFHTKIDDFDEERYGRRYSNVSRRPKPYAIPVLKAES